MPVTGNKPTARRPGRPSKASAGDTKTALRQAALRLFARHGYSGTSIRAIAREVGLSESVLYAHFDSKRAIFDSVLAELGPRSSVDVVENLDAELDEADPPRYLRELVAAFLDEWDRLDARLLISFMTRDGLVHSRELQEGLLAMRASAAQLFERWIDAGLVPAELGAPEDLALSFTAPIGLIRLMYMHADATDDERAAARSDILRHVEIFTRAVFRP
jgi:AcrR family transcriptional regulator